jgi:hypothetical protein
VDRAAPIRRVTGPSGTLGTPKSRLLRPFRTPSRRGLHPTDLQVLSSLFLASPVCACAPRYNPFRNNGLCKSPPHNSIVLNPLCNFRGEGGTPCIRALSSGVHLRAGAQEK